MKKDINLIYGKNPLIEAVRARRIIKVFLINGFNDEKILSLLRDNNIQPTYIAVNEMEKMCKGVHQGVAAQLKPYQTVGLEEIIARAKNKDKKIIVMLDNINDPHNLGAVLRSADFFGVSGVILPKHHSVSLSATVAKTSAGAINYVPVAIVNNLNQAIKTLKDAGYWIVSTDGSADTIYSDIKYDFPVVIVIGSEGKGISSLVLRNSDYVVKIPQFGQVNCLNASVAAGIILAEVSKTNI
ncbi:MAG TPA: 23S rRNA (guanosine(2251)-2'-O)-methyltransferase RlmB [Erysipelotrichaceae bacterium]|nr:23S rRNA (guanosine(2251)-2'-O)-methyltransferase RlmB [Erysipelotrichaceae bacterium]